jgi:FAD/FMN-containing dehydrogenase
VTPPSRRSLLRAAGLLAGGSALASCTGSPPSPPARASTAGHSPGAGAVPAHRKAQRPATAADWRALGRTLQGEVHRRGRPGYRAASEIYDPRFDHVRPQAVAAVASADDVSRVIEFAIRHELPVCLRAGGHSYLGASTGRGLVVDMRPMNAVNVRSGSVACGSGVQLIDVYAALAARGAGIPAGSCPSVGLTGLLLGGGVGVVARRYGLTCDQLLSADVVTAAGEQITCDDRRNSDLFFALRGGGGSFAAVTSLTLRTHPVGSLANFTLTWPWSAAGEVLAAWQRWATQAPDALWSTCHLLTDGDPATSPAVSVSGVYVGSADAASPYVDALAGAVPGTPAGRYLADGGYLDTMLLEAGCDHETVAQCHVVGTTPTAEVQRTSFVAASDLFSRPLPRAAVDAVTRAVEIHQNDPRLGDGGVAFDVLGGAIARVPSDATAFAHRSALFGAQWSSSWAVDRPGDQAVNERALSRLQASAHRYSDGAYANYPTAGRRNARRAYWGTNLPRLRAIKRRWDPHDVFHQPQGVPA